MAGLTDTNGHWYVVFKYRNFKVKESLATTSRIEAERVKRKIERALRDGTFNYLNFFGNSRNLEKFGLSKGGLPLTLGEYAQVWLEKKRTLVAYKGYAFTLKNHILSAALANRPLAEINKTEIELFVADLCKTMGYTDSSKRGGRAINLTIARLRTIFGDAFFDGVIDKDPMLRVKNVREQRSKIDPFQIDEVAAILSAAHGGDRALLTTLFFAGLRPNEAFTLKWSDIDWRRHLISVERTGGEIGVHPTKTLGSERDVVMLDAVYEALREQRSRTELKSREGWIFPSEADTPLSINNFRRRNWEPLLRKAGVKRRNFYQTRHTYATFMLGYETPQWVAAQLGHMTTQMVIQRYVKWKQAPASRAGGAANEEIDKALAGAAQGGKHQLGGAGA